MSAPRVLIACVGNIFLGDDGFGVEVARRLAGRTLPDGVVLKDFGIRGFDLAFALAEGYDLTILVDACPRGSAPGTLHVIEPDPVGPDTTVDSAPIEMHGMNPMNVLRMVRSLGGEAKRILVVGCEPADLGSEEDGKLGLSEPVEAAVAEAVSLVERLAAEAVLQSH